MTSPQIKIVISLACISIVYAFICQIRLTHKASKISNFLKQKYPDLWSELNFVARNSSGGYPGIKLIHKKKIVEIPWFEPEFKKLQFLEKQLILGIIVGVILFGILFLGLKYLGWHW